MAGAIRDSRTDAHPFSAIFCTVVMQARYRNGYCERWLSARSGRCSISTAAKRSPISPRRAEYFCQKPDVLRSTVVARRVVAQTHWCHGSRRPDPKSMAERPAVRRAGAMMWSDASCNSSNSARANRTRWHSSISRPHIAGFRSTRKKLLISLSRSFYTSAYVCGCATTRQPRHRRHSVSRVRRKLLYRPRRPAELPW